MPKKKSLNYIKLRKKWVKRQLELERSLFQKHKESFEWLSQNGKQFTVGTLAGLFLLASPAVPTVSALKTEVVDPQQTPGKDIGKQNFIVYDLYNILPKEVAPLDPVTEEKVAEVLTRDYGISVKPSIGDIRLNTSYGYIGQEQHLARYPGDNIYSHFDTQNEASDYWSYGMAPGLGAWGYFSNSQSAMTKEDVLREKYYIAVQTFLAPGFEKDPKKYVDFFKYRKMLVVNPQNGKAVVAVIGDAGPAAWTGKQLGGSPEVMKYLQRVDGRQKGPVLYYFIEDPENKIPLGPVGI